MGDNGISARGCEAGTWEGLHLLMGCSFNLARIFKSIIKIAPALMLLKAFFLHCNIMCNFWSHHSVALTRTANDRDWEICNIKITLELRFWLHNFLSDRCFYSSLHWRKFNWNMKTELLKIAMKSSTWESVQHCRDNRTFLSTGRTYCLSFSPRHDLELQENWL